MIVMKYGSEMIEALRKQPFTEGWTFHDLKEHEVVDSLLKPQS